MSAQDKPNTSSQLEILSADPNSVLDLPPRGEDNKGIKAEESKNSEVDTKSTKGTPVTEVKVKKDYSYNIIARYAHWSDDKINIEKVKDLRSGHAVLMLQRKLPITRNEIQLQRTIEANPASIHELTSRNLYRIEIQEDPRVVKDSRRDSARLIDRFSQDSISIINDFSFVLAINPIYVTSHAIRNFSTNSTLIAIFTPDFNRDMIVDPLDDADVVIGSKDIVEFYSSRAPLRRAHALKSISGYYSQLREIFSSLTPKEINVMLPIYNAFQYHPEYLDVDTSATDVIIRLKERAAASTVATTFSSFLVNFVDEVDCVLTSERVYQKYQNMLRDVSRDGLINFLRVSLADGLRMEMRRADGTALI